MIEKDKLHDPVPYKLFWRYARNYLPEMRILFREAHLSPHPKYEWNNTVIAHSLTVAAVSEILGTWLSFSLEKREHFIRNGLLHDWDKRQEVVNDIADDSFNKAQKYVQRTIDHALLEATKPGFSVHLLDGIATPDQKLFYYADVISMGSTIVIPRERIDEVISNKRRPEALLRKVFYTGTRGPLLFWEAERMASYVVAHDLMLQLRANGQPIESPDDIPFLICQELKNF